MSREIETFCLPEDIIDTHVHMRGWNESHKTTPYQVLNEAFGSKITISMAMPNTSPSIETYELGLDYHLHMVSHPGFIPGKLQKLYIGANDSNLQEVRKFLQLDLAAGVKRYPSGGLTTGKLGVARDSSVMRHMYEAAEAEKPFASHCDGTEHTIEAEVRDVENIINLATSLNLKKWLRVIICHVSCRQSAELILQAQKNGYQIAIEIAPHYLWFDDRGTNWKPGLDPVFYKCFNNLRGPEHREYLVSLLKTDNPLVFIGSDSACHTTIEKLSGNAPGGIPSNQEMVPVLITLARKHGISEKRIAELICFNAADFFKIKVSHQMIRYQIEEKEDDLQYNHGAATNPWNGSKLRFPVKTV